MATIEAVTPRVYAGTPRRGPITRLLEDERWLASFLLLPTIVLLGLFIAYPFVKGVLLAVTDTRVGVPGHFVGLANFDKLWHDDIFRVAVYNTFLYTFVTTIFKLVLGLWLALLLNRHFKGKAFVRAFILLPFIIPTVLSTFAWKWMFDPTFSVINWLLFHLGMITGRINWLGDPDLAIISMVVVLFSVIQTFADFQLVYVLTGGGPANHTHLFATYAYQIGVGTGLLSEGAAVSLAIFPVLLLVVIIQLVYIRRVETV